MAVRSDAARWKSVRKKTYAMARLSASRMPQASGIRLFR